MIPKNIIKYIENSGAKYEFISHKTVYTACDKAATLKVKPETIAKSLVLKGERINLIALIPGNKNLDKNRLKSLLNGWLRKRNLKTVKKLDFSTELWMKKNFKGIKVGSVAPIGGFYKLPVFVERGLAKAQKIIVNGGDYNTSIKINFAGLKKIAPELIVGNFSKVKK